MGSEFENIQWPLQNDSGSDFSGIFANIFTSSPIFTCEPRGNGREVNEENIQWPLQNDGGGDFDDIFTNIFVSSPIFTGEPRGNRHDVNAEIMLKDSFKRKWFPSRQDQIFIADLTNLSYEQVKTWFEYKRRTMKREYEIPPEQMLNIKKIDEGVFLENVYRVADPAPYQFHRATREPTRSQQGVQLPQVPLVQEQFQPHQGQDQFQDQFQVQVQWQPQPQPQLHQLVQPQECWLNQQGQFPDNSPVQPWEEFPARPWRASKLPKSRIVHLLKREADDLSFRSAREKWLKEQWLKEENMKVQKWIEYQSTIIFALSEQERLLKTELAKADERLMKSEKRSRKIKAANAKMLEYISKK